MKSNKEKKLTINPRFSKGDKIKVIVSKNLDNDYREERKGAIGIIEKQGISLGKVCYWVNFGDHNSWREENEIELI